MRKFFTFRRMVFAVVIIGAGWIGFRMAAPQQFGDPSAASAGVDPSSAPTIDPATVVVDAAAVPAGWVAQPTAPANGEPLCPVLEAATFAPTAVAQAQFVNPAGTQMLAEKVSSYSDGNAAAVLAAVRVKGPKCASFAANGKTYKLTEFTQPGLGDEAVAFQVATVGTTPIVADVVYVRVGDTVLTMSHLVSGGTDVNGTEAFVRAALAKAGVAVP